MNGASYPLLDGPRHSGGNPCCGEDSRGKGSPRCGAGHGAQGGDPVPPADMAQVSADQRLDQLRRIARREAEFRELAALHIERVRSALLLEQDIERRTRVLQQSLDRAGEKLRVAAAETSGSESQPKNHSERETRRAASRLTDYLGEAEFASPARRRRREAAADAEHEMAPASRLDPMAALAAARRRMRARGRSGARNALEVAKERPQRRGSARSFASSPSTTSASHPTRLRAGSFSGLLTATSPRPTGAATPRLAAPSPLAYHAARDAGTPTDMAVQAPRRAPRSATLVPRKARSCRPSREAPERRGRDARTPMTDSAARPPRRMRRARSAPPRRLVRAAATAARQQEMAALEESTRVSTPDLAAPAASMPGPRGAHATLTIADGPAGADFASAEAALRQEVVGAVTRLVQDLERETRALRARAERLRTSAEEEAAAQGRLSSVDAVLRRALERVSASGLGPKEVATRQRQALDEVTSLWDALGVPERERASKLWEWLGSSDLCSPAQRAMLDAASRLEKRLEVARVRARRGRAHPALTSRIAGGDSPRHGTAAGEREAEGSGRRAWGRRAGAAGATRRRGCSLRGARGGPTSGGGSCSGPRPAPPRASSAAFVRPSLASEQCSVLPRV